MGKSGKGKVNKRRRCSAIPKPTSQRTVSCFMQPSPRPHRTQLAMLGQMRWVACSAPRTPEIDGSCRRLLVIFTASRCTIQPRLCSLRAWLELHFFL
jgi:hypothetical protein